MIEMVLVGLGLMIFRPITALDVLGGNPRESEGATSKEGDVSEGEEKKAVGTTTITALEKMAGGEGQGSSFI